MVVIVVVQMGPLTSQKIRAENFSVVGFRVVEGLGSGIVELLVLMVYGCRGFRVWDGRTFGVQGCRGFRV